MTLEKDGLETDVIRADEREDEELPADRQPTDGEEGLGSPSLDGVPERPKQSFVTLKDVAARANVSPTTASLFFKGRQDVCSESTAARLRQAAADLQYSVNRGRRRGEGKVTAGRGASTATTDGRRAGHAASAELTAHRAMPLLLPHTGPYVLGVCMPHDTVPSSAASTHLLQSYPNTFLEQVWRGISHVADIEDCRILQYPLRVRESESTEPFLREFPVSGLIMAARANDPRPGSLAAAGVPVVLVGRVDEIPEGCGAVFVLESDTMALGLSHLWQLGHRRIAHIAGPLMHDGGSSEETAKRRLDRYSAWTQIRRVYDPGLIFSCNDPENVEKDVSGAVAQMMSLPKPPTAIFCGNDAVAVAVCRAAQSIELAVPDQLSVLGIDNSVYGAENKPSISSVEVPYEQVGIQAVVQVTRLLEGAAAAACRVAIAVTNLIARESTGPAPPS